ncbi:MAG TPA: tetratricopeptide repeat protein, partial [Acetobacteraceae bacterium]|nr:tetratricopeptide repeat protein [Acetobacteraceae bacterium]
GVRHGRRRPLLLAGTALCWATALPWVVVPLNVPLSEHRLYGPLAGLCLCGAAAARSFRTTWSWPRARALSAAAAVLLAFLAGRRSLDYVDERRLWEPVVASDPANARAWMSLGLAEQRHGDEEAARPSFARALAYRPNYRRARQEWLSSLLRLPEERQAPFLALVLAEELRRQRPEDPWPRIQHANALIQTGVLTGDAHWYREAEAVALSCLEIAEKKGLVFRVAAEARRRLHDLPGAIAHLDRSMALGLDHYSVRVDRGLLLLEAGRTAEARQELARCLQLAPLDPGVQELLRRCQPAGPGR